MKITFLATGKTTDKKLAELLNHYENRIKKYCSFKVVFTADLKLPSSTTPDILRMKEFELQQKHLSENDYIILLDEKGKQFTSEQFSKLLEKKQLENRKQLVFISGGAYGFSKHLTAKAHESIALSAMTFPHDLVRVIFAEQLYRAFSILHNERYHH
ncbi:MAG: 23S rRNA (pseudouridine(1915)-N(3))-methyltransferase RlmH [Chitinophagales bacterium]